MVPRIGIGRGDDFVSGTNAERFHTSMQGLSARTGGHTILGAHQFGVGFFKGRHVPVSDWIRHQMPLLVVLTTESTTFSSQKGHSGQVFSFFRTGSPPRAASLPEVLPRAPQTGRVSDAITASELAETVARKRRRVRSLD